MAPQRGLELRRQVIILRLVLTQVKVEQPQGVVYLVIKHSVMPPLPPTAASIQVVLLDSMVVAVVEATMEVVVEQMTVAGVTAVLVYHLPLRLNIVTAIAVAVLVCMTAERFKPMPTPGGHA